MTKDLERVSSSSDGKHNGVVFEEVVSYITTVLVLITSSPRFGELVFHILKAHTDSSDRVSGTEHNQTDLQLLDGRVFGGLKDIKLVHRQPQRRALPC